MASFMRPPSLDFFWIHLVTTDTQSKKRKYSNGYIFLVIDCWLDQTSAIPIYVQVDYINKAI